MSTDPDDLAEHVAERTRFLAVARHKLKTPLAVMGGWAAALDQWDLLTPEERADGIQAIQRATTELQHQIEDLLDEASSELLRESLRAVPIPLRPFVEDELTRLDLDRDRHPVTVDIGAHRSVIADPDALRRVLLHLLDNARKYSPDGGPILLRCPPGEPVRLEVHDRGIGLGDDVDVFAPFERATNASGVARGTGLGLHVVRTLVRRMGGAVGATDGDEGGTVLWIELPATGDDR